MGRLFLIALTFILSNVALGQSNTDYEVAMSKIMRFYNGKEMDSLRSLFADKSELGSRGKWDIEEFHEIEGKIISYKQTLSYDGEVTFQVYFTGGCWSPQAGYSLTTFSLDKNNKVFNFSLIGGWR